MKIKILLVISVVLMGVMFNACDDTVDCCAQVRSWYMGDSTAQYPGVLRDTFQFQTNSDDVSLSFRFNSLCLSDQLLFELYGDEQLVETLETFDFQSSYFLDTEEDVLYTLYTSVVPRPDPPGACIRLGEVEVTLSY